jgi:hypothetical protein
MKMKEARLGQLLRSALAIAMASPALAFASASCGGSIERNEPSTGAPPTGAPPTGAPPIGTAPEACSSAVLPEDNQCRRSFQRPCSVTAAELAQGYLGGDRCTALCPPGPDPKFSYVSCGLMPDANQEQYLYCGYCASGRRPDGLEPVAAAAGPPLGAFFAGVSHLEAASVIAFRTLADELETFAAPRALLQRAERAARDEVRHTRATATLALRFGANPGGWSDTPAVSPAEARSLEAIATENAVEGCVRETFGALLGAWQAEHANDVHVQRTMRGIARDEARHAALAWSVADWIRPLLDDAARLRVELAFEQAIVDLAAEVSGDPNPAVAGPAGLPTAAGARRLVDALAEVLWHAA